MGRAPCCDKANVKRGPWSPEEDATLKNYLQKHGTGGNWIALPKKAGLKRCGKSCRLRWLNYLRPHIRLGGFTEDEDKIICTLYATIGSRWSLIAAQLSGRTDNDVKNHWNTKLKKKFLVGNSSYNGTISDNMSEGTSSYVPFSSFSPQTSQLADALVLDHKDSYCFEQPCGDTAPIAASKPMKSSEVSDVCSGEISGSCSMPYNSKEEDSSSSAFLAEKNDHIKWFGFKQEDDEYDASMPDDNFGYDHLFNGFASDEQSLIHECFPN